MKKRTTRFDPRRRHLDPLLYEKTGMFIHELLLGEVSKDMAAGLITNPEELKDLKRMLTKQMNPVEKAITIRCGKDAFETFVHSLGVISYAAEEAMKKRIKHREDSNEDEIPS